MDRLSDITEIKRILSGSGFSFSKALGQNFLVDPSVCPEMARLCTDDENTGIIEIGPGIGVLTNELAKVSKKVVAIELDTRLLPVLEKTLSDHENVKVINGDVMKLDLAALIAEEFAGMDVVVCANLPYYITSPVIMKLLEERVPVSSMTVMVQKEAADRLCADPGTRECGAVTLAVHYYSEPQLLFPVPSSSFYPSPKVDSAVIKLCIRTAPAADVRDEKLFFRVVRGAFSQRRKTLVNSLSSMLGLEKSAVISAAEQAGISVLARAEQLTLKEFAALCDAISKVMP